LLASEIAKGQKHDRLSKEIITWLVSKRGPEPVAGIQEYRALDGTLYKVLPDDNSGRTPYRLYVPEALRLQAIEAAHTAAHIGAEATIKSLEQAVYWPSY